MTIADLGCGPALLKKYSSKKINFYDKKLEKDFINKIDLDKINKLPNKFNIVINMGVIEYLNSINEYIELMSRSDTKFLIIWFTSIKFNFLKIMFLKKIKQRTKYKNIITVNELIRMFEVNNYVLFRHIQNPYNKNLLKI